MPPAYVSTIREEVYYEYAKLISRSACGSLQRPFITEKNVDSLDRSESFVICQKGTATGNEGGGHLDRVWSFQIVMGSEKGSPFSAVIRNGNDRQMGKVSEKDHIAGSQGKVFFPVRLNQAFRDADGAGDSFYFPLFQNTKEIFQEREVGWMFLKGVNEDHGVQANFLTFQTLKKRGHFQLARSFLT